DLVSAPAFTTGKTARRFSAGVEKGGVEGSEVVSKAFAPDSGNSRANIRQSGEDRRFHGNRVADRVGQRVSNGRKTSQRARATTRGNRWNLCFLPSLPGLGFRARRTH